MLKPVSIMAAKYLFKYVTKLLDRAMAKLLDDYIGARGLLNLFSTGASEACWRLIQFDTTTSMLLSMPSEST